MRVTHGALIDSELLAQVYLELLGGRQPHLIEIASKRTAASSSAETFNLKRPEAIQARSFPPSEEEVQLHEALVNSIKDSLWTAKNAKGAHS